MSLTPHWESEGHSCAQDSDETAETSLTGEYVMPEIAVPAGQVPAASTVCAFVELQHMPCSCSSPWHGDKHETCVQASSGTCVHIWWSGLDDDGTCSGVKRPPPRPTVVQPAMPEGAYIATGMLSVKRTCCSSIFLAKPGALPHRV